MKVFLLFIALCLFTLKPGLSAAYDDADCRACHGIGSKESRLRVSLGEFEDSVHGRDLACADCHEDIVDESHEQARSSTVDCTGCHEQPNRHGQGASGGAAPRCWDCHTRHHVLSPGSPRSSVHASNLTRTCRGCHPSETGDRDFLSALPAVRIASHGKQDFSTAYTMGNCLGCHQGKAAHGESERLSGDNCDRCHLRENGESPLLGRMHPEADPGAQPVVFASALLYQAGLWALVLAGFVFFTRARTKRDH